MPYVLVRNGMEYHADTGIGGVREEGVLCLANDIIDDSGIVDLAGGDLEITEQASPNMSVHIAKGRLWIKNSSWVQNTYDSNKFYPCLVDEADDLNIDPNSSGLTRNDIICVKLDLAGSPGDSGEYAVTLVVVKGTDGGGVPATPANHYKLAEIEVGDGVTAIYTANITDTRIQLSLSESISISSQSIGNAINNSSAKTDPHDDDMFGLMDSEAGNILKKFSWANLKAKFGLFINSLIAGFELEEMTTPSTPDSGKVRLYAKDKDGVSTLYYLQDDGTEVEIGSGGGVSSSVSAIYNIINSTFSVCTYGITSTTSVAAGAYDCFDKWKRWVAADGGSLPTLTQSQQQIENGELDDIDYFYRLSPDGAGSGFGAAADYQIEHNIKNGNRLMAGEGNQVTVSFWARSSIANKKIGLAIWQGYGTGGSPSSDEDIAGDNWTLTSDWVRYSKTFTLNSIAAKTFGSNDNDVLGISIFTMWGSGVFATLVNSAGVAEDFVGAGNIDITGVQIDPGDTALPYRAKNIEQEKQDVKRFHLRLAGEGINGLSIGFGHGITSTRIDAGIVYGVEMCFVPTCTINSMSANDASAARALTLNAGSIYGRKSATLQFDVTGATADRAYKIQTNSTAGYVDLDVYSSIL